MFTNNEIEVLKGEISFCKAELIKRIKNILENATLNYDEKKNMERLLEEVVIGEYDYIEPDFSKDEILGYYINIAEGTAKRAIGSGFSFGYDNNSHEVVLDSMCWVDVE